MLGLENERVEDVVQFEMGPWRTKTCEETLPALIIPYLPEAVDVWSDDRGLRRAEIGPFADNSSLTIFIVHTIMQTTQAVCQVKLYLIDRMRYSGRSNGLWNNAALGLNGGRAEVDGSGKLSSGRLSQHERPCSRPVRWAGARIQS